MNALLGIYIATIAMHGVLNDCTFLLFFIPLSGLWFLFVQKTRVTRDNGKRKTLMAASWNGKMILIL
jgi:hypothetical protein